MVLLPRLTSINSAHPPKKVWTSLGDIAQPKGDGVLPRAVYAFRDHIAIAASDNGRVQSAPGRKFEVFKRRRGKGLGKAQTKKGRGPDQERTFTIKSRASAETFGGIRRSTFAIRL